MNRTLLHTMLCFLLFSNMPAQESSADSLIDLTERLTGHDLGRVCYELSLTLRDTQTDSALFYANQAELILTRNDPDNLLPLLFKSKGKIYEIKMAYDLSLSYYGKAYEEFIKLENYRETANCALNMGNIYYELGDFSEAYYYYMQSLNAFERDGDRHGIAMMENNLGIVAHDMGNLDEAEKHYFNAYRIYREKELLIDECRALNNIGLILYDKLQYDSALVYFNEVLGKINPDSVRNDEERTIVSGVYNNMALAFSDKEELDMALQYLRKGLALARRAKDEYYLGSFFNNIGSVFGEMKQQDSALYYLHRALQLSQLRGFRHLELEVYDELARLHAGIGSYASAYNWLLRYDTIYKELFNESQAERIARLRARYEQELAEKEIEQLQSEAQVQRTLNKVFVIFIIVIAGLVVIIAINLRSKQKTNRMLEERNIQISQALEKLSDSEKELQKLNRSKDRIFSVVAHDLRNPVAAVTGFSELLYDNFEQFPVETQKEYMLQIVQGTLRIQNLLENLLIWARSQMKAVKFDPESFAVDEIVEECIREMKANLDHKKIECRFHKENPCMVYADKAMIHTVLRNLVMNAIKFSFPGGKIRITSGEDRDFCRIAVSDDGIGIHPEIQEKLFEPNGTASTPGTAGESGSGLGLVICKEFLVKNGGEISVESEPGNGSTFLIRLPRPESG